MSKKVKVILVSIMALLLISVGAIYLVKTLTEKKASGVMQKFYGEVSKITDDYVELSEVDIPSFSFSVSYTRFITSKPYFCSLCRARFVAQSRRTFRILFAILFGSIVITFVLTSLKTFTISISSFRCKSTCQAFDSANDIFPLRVI